MYVARVEGLDEDSLDLGLVSAWGYTLEEVELGVLADGPIVDVDVVGVVVHVDVLGGIEESLVDAEGECPPVQQRVGSPQNW